LKNTNDEKMKFILSFFVQICNLLHGIFMKNSCGLKEISLLLQAELPHGRPHPQWKPAQQSLRRHSQ
jgi:hypothetical protein